MAAPAPAADVGERGVSELRTPILLRLADVTPRPVSWLWPGRIPLGKLTVVDGDPGLGKSTLSLDLAARVSRGARMPDGTPGVSGGVLLLSAEDAADDTIVPRLLAAEAELAWIAQLPAVTSIDGESLPVLPLDTPALAQAIGDLGAPVRLVVIDPLVAFLSEGVNSWRDQDVRRALHALACFAETTGAAVLVIRHLTKSNGTPALYRGGGSIGIIGAARAGLLVARDPEDPTRRILAATKMNLAPEPPSLSFRLDVVQGQPRIAWGGESPHGADVLVSQPQDEEERHDAQDLRAFVREMLEVVPRTQKEVIAACRSAGFDVSERTIRRARKAAGVTVQRQGFGPGSVVVWSLGTHSGHIPDIGDRDSELSPMSGMVRYDAPPLPPEPPLETPEPDLESPFDPVLDEGDGWEP